jgi:hypothetical protein
MANIPTTSHAVYNAQARREYITTSAFNTDFYTYTTSMSPPTYEMRGTLAANVTGANATNCPANRILRENGKKLYPDANPQISTYMVGVYDASSGLSGYIDPNSPKFAVYNSDKPVYLSDGVNPNGGLTDQGQPVYTRGTITAGGDITSTAGNITATAGNITATAGNITATTGSLSVGGSATVGANIIVSTDAWVKGNFFLYRSINALATGAVTLTTSQISGILTQAAAGTQALTLPSTNNIYIFLASTVGTTCEFVYINTAAQNVTLTPADGSTTIVGSAVINNTFSRFIVRAASATPTVVVYRVA